MKGKVVLIGSAVIMLSVFLSGCKKENEGLNRITVSGNTNTEYNQDYIPDGASYVLPRIWDCATSLYRSDIWIHFASGSTFWMALYLPDSEGRLPTGTFSYAPACSEGFTASFYYAPPKKPAGVCFSSGTVIIGRKGDVYDIKLDLEIDPDCGGGTLKGGFHGTMTVEEVR